MVSAVRYEVSGFLSRRAQYSSDVGLFGLFGFRHYWKMVLFIGEKKPQLQGGGGGCTGAFYDVEIRLYWSHQVNCAVVCYAVCWYIKEISWNRH